MWVGPTLQLYGQNNIQYENGILNMKIGIWLTRSVDCKKYKEDLCDLGEKAVFLMTPGGMVLCDESKLSVLLLAPCNNKKKVIKIIKL